MNKKRLSVQEREKLLDTNTLHKTKRILANFSVNKIYRREGLKAIIGPVIINMASSFLPYLAICILALVCWSYNLHVVSLGLCAVNAFFLVRIFIIQHDCGHKSYLPNKFKNTQSVIGWICSLFSWFPYDYWAKTHDFHHKHSGKFSARDIGDINFLKVSEYNKKSPIKKMYYRYFRHPITLLLIVPIFYQGISNRWPFSFDEIKSLKSLFSIRKLKALISRDNKVIPVSIKKRQIMNNTLIASVYIALTLIIGWKFLIIQGITIFIFTSIAFWFFYIQHSFEEAYQRNDHDHNPDKAALLGASNYKIPEVFDWLVGRITKHPWHHLNSGIPNYFLKKAHKSVLSKVEVLKECIVSISFKESLLQTKNKLYDESLQRYITFKEAKRIQVI